jgi:CheY-like chemotaxis protein
MEERRRAEEALKQADRRKDEFLAVLAHELRNPLAPLRNTLRLVRPAGEGPEADAIRSACSLMERQVDQLVRLVDELLDLSRISRGKVSLRKGLVELGPIVQQAVETVRPICESSGADIEIRLPAEPLYLDADPIRLGQAIANLLHNACKFSERGGKVRLEAEVADGAMPEVVVRVRDEGIGIAPDQLSRIFEMFAQVDTSVERSQSGLGIGLTLVRSLVEMHGGSVEARSDGIGKGSEFVVRLALRRDGAPVELAAAVAESAPVSGRRVLVVDDNRDSAESLAMLLRHLGHTTEVAYDGEHALSTAESFRPDVLLLDLGMPRMSGFELCRRIRASDWGEEVLLIAQTGWGQDRDRERALEAGFDGHLVKPVDHEALLKLLARSRGAGE